jgi:hypothetical protein
MCCFLGGGKVVTDVNKFFETDFNGISVFFIGLIASALIDAIIAD